MIPLFITIIIVIVCLEIYLRYYINELTIGKKQLCNESTTKLVPEPWDKIDVDRDKNKYYIKINNFDENKYLEWKKLHIKIGYDVSNKYFIIKTKSEENALAIANLFISNMNKEIDFQYIVDNDLINISRLKAKTYKLVRLKLIESIKEGCMRESNNIEKNKSVEHFDTTEIDYNEEDGIIQEQFQQMHAPIIESYEPDAEPRIEPRIEPYVEQIKSIQNDIDEIILNAEPIEKIRPPTSFISPYGGSEYATISF